MGADNGHYEDDVTIGDQNDKLNTRCHTPPQVSPLTIRWGRVA